MSNFQVTKNPPLYSTTTLKQRCSNPKHVCIILHQRPRFGAVVEADLAVASYPQVLQISDCQSSFRYARIIFPPRLTFKLLKWINGRLITLAWWTITDCRVSACLISAGVIELQLQFRCNLPYYIGTKTNVVCSMVRGSCSRSEALTAFAEPVQDAVKNVVNPSSSHPIVSEITQCTFKLIPLNCETVNR